MKRTASVPLAWKNLTHNYRRLFTAVAGITFAVVLMFVERGFQHALFDSTTYCFLDIVSRQSRGGGIAVTPPPSLTRS